MIRTAFLLLLLSAPCLFSSACSSGIPHAGHGNIGEAPRDEQGADGIVVSDLSMEKGKGRDRAVSGTIRNVGERPVRRLKVTLFFEGREGTPIADDENYPLIMFQYEFGKEEGIKPGEELEFEQSIGEGPDGEQEAMPRAKVTDVEFEE